MTSEWALANRMNRSSVMVTRVLPLSAFVARLSFLPSRTSPALMSKSVTWGRPAWSGTGSREAERTQAEPLRDLVGAGDCLQTTSDQEEVASGGVEGEVHAGSESDAADAMGLNARAGSEGGGVDGHGASDVRGQGAGAPVRAGSGKGSGASIWGGAGVDDRRWRVISRMGHVHRVGPPGTAPAGCEQTWVVWSVGARKKTRCTVILAVKAYANRRAIMECRRETVAVWLIAVSAFCGEVAIRIALVGTVVAAVWGARSK